jgi:predicted nucleic acid-binding protein
LETPVCRDKDDDVVLATARAGKCDLIVTGDQDLLAPEQFLDIPIVTTGDFWRREVS